VTNYVTHINVLAATDGSQGPKNAQLADCSSLQNYSPGGKELENHNV